MRGRISSGPGGAVDDTPWARRERLVAAGRAATLRGDVLTAIDAYEQATRLEPSDPEAWSLLAELLAARGRHPEAAHAHYQVAELYARGGMPREGLRYVAHVLELDPVHGPANTLRELLEKRTGVSMAQLVPSAEFRAAASRPFAQPFPEGTPIESLPAPTLDRNPLIADEAEGGEVVEIEAEEPTFITELHSQPMAEPEEEPAAELLRLVTGLLGTGPDGLALSPLLDALDSNGLRILTEQGTLERVEMDDPIVTMGEAGSSLFVLLEGEVVVELPGEPAIELAVLRAGAFFGEAAIITALPRNASVRALTPVTLLELPRGAVRDLIAACPTAFEVLMRFFRARLVATVLVTSPLFAPLGTEERRKLVTEFRMRELPPGGVVLEAGSEGPGLFLLLAGHLEVVAADEVGTVLGELAQGEVFGEMSLLGGGAATAEVRARTRAWVLLLPVATYQAIVPQHPELERGLRALAATRKARNQKKR